jgi:hypothetical protein
MAGFIFVFKRRIPAPAQDSIFLCHAEELHLMG